jgi:hypothetical protein
MRERGGLRWLRAVLFSVLVIRFVGSAIDGSAAPISGSPTHLRMAPILHNASHGLIGQ